MLQERQVIVVKFLQDKQKKGRDQNQLNHLRRGNKKRIN